MATIHFTSGTSLQVADDVAKQIVDSLKNKDASVEWTIIDDRNEQLVVQLYAIEYIKLKKT